MALRQRNDSNHTGTPAAVSVQSQSDQRGPCHLQSLTSHADPYSRAAQPPHTSLGTGIAHTLPEEPCGSRPLLTTVWTEASLSLEASHPSEDFSQTLFFWGLFKYKIILFTHLFKSI